VAEGADRSGDRLARSPRAVHRRLSEGEGSVLLHLDTAAYHGLNDVGTAIWERLERPSTLDELYGALEGQLDGAPPTWRDDVRAFVEALLERDLLRRAEPDPGSGG
jgi:hypothetical protein